MSRCRFFYLLILAALLAACTLPGASPADGEARTALPTSASGAGILPGEEENPIVLAAQPGAGTEAMAAAEELARQLSGLTGLAIISAPAESNLQLVDSLGEGIVHVALLSPMAYLMAHEKNYADAALATIVDGQEWGAAQFLVSAARLTGPTGFKVYFDPNAGNLVDMPIALAQFKDTRPCWTDAHSLAGYILPLGILTQNDIPTKTGSFLQGDDTVVQTLYRDTEGTLCDFGVTAVDSRALVAEELSDVTSRVVVVWRSEAVLPNDAIAYAESLPDDMRIHITAAFLAIAATEDGSALLRTSYRAEGLKLIDDTYFDRFRGYVEFCEIHQIGINLR
jgi:phosphonate transport system substrate-binding protein